VVAAIFGLVGVVLGGFISSGVTYMMTRRTEKLQARASARLLQNELHAVGQRLSEFLPQYEIIRKIADGLSIQLAWKAIDESPVLDDAVELASGGVIPAPGLADFTLDQWPEHRGRLAEVLSTADWYAVSEAYSAIQVGQSLEAKFAYDGKINLRLELDFKKIRDQLVAGADALSRLAGRTLTDDGSTGVDWSNLIGEEWDRLVAEAHQGKRKSLPDEQE
jgi:hypothetical protein